jgi:hypothetical protein
MRQGRLDYIRDPAERRFVAKMQLCAAAAVLLMFAGVAVFAPGEAPVPPTAPQAVPVPAPAAGAAPAPAGVEPAVHDDNTGYAEGA